MEVMQLLQIICQRMRWKDGINCLSRKKSSV